ncbi:hypothetical protein BWI15_01225 [Kribbella sp. ALI-6-A]|nr:hypothetical protein BWI15_01225 [Kribbella sp. ALI-6-A]
MKWSEQAEIAHTHGLLGKTLYVISSTPRRGLQPILDVLDEHIAYQTQLERDGVMFAAGPVANDDRTEWLGEGLFMYRASSAEHARELAEADPMHKCGARTFTIREWMLNEGTFTIQVFYSTGDRPRIQ